MKKTIIILLVLMMFSISNAQKLDIHKVDEFSGKTIKRIKTYFYGKAVKNKDESFMA